MGKSVWYANSEDIERDLDIGWARINEIPWRKLEHNGFYFDQELLAASAGYVRNAFVLASFNEYSEYEHLEKILFDTISTEPIIQTDDPDTNISTERTEMYKRYKTDDYQPTAHEYRAEEARPIDLFS